MYFSIILKNTKKCSWKRLYYVINDVYKKQLLSFTTYRIANSMYAFICTAVHYAHINN